MLKFRLYMIAGILAVIEFATAADKVEEIISARKTEIDKARQEFSKAVEQSDQLAKKVNSIAVAT